MSNALPIDRLLRHLEFTRQRLGEDGAPDLAAWLLVSGQNAVLWKELGPGAAALLDVHERLVIGIGYHRRMAHLSRKARGMEHAAPSTDAFDIDRLEASFVWSALSGWLPRLGELGMDVRNRMEKYGYDAVGHHLIQKLTAVHPATDVLAAAGVLREASLAIDTAILSTSDLESGVSLLQETRESLEQRMLEDLAHSGARLGWNTLACLWISMLQHLGASPTSLGKTERYDDGESHTIGTFDLLSTYPALLA